MERMARVAVALRTTIVRSDTAKLALSELGHPRPRRSEPHHGACSLRPESGQLSDRLAMSALCQYVWPGHAVQDGLPRSTNVRAASMYQASEVEQFAPGHHGYPRASEAD